MNIRVLTRRISSTVGFVALAVAFAALPPAAAEVLFEARYWEPDLTSRLELSDSLPVESLSLEGDLGLREDEVWDGRFVWRPSRRTALRLAFSPIDLAGEQVVMQTVEIGGEVFELATRVQTDLQIDYGRLAFAWQFLSTGDGRFRLGPMVEIKGFEGDARVSAPDLFAPLAGAVDFETGFASAGVMLDAEPSERVHVFAELTELLDDDDGEITDWEAGIRVFVGAGVSISAGMRSLEVEITDSGERLTLDLEGAFLGVGFGF